VVPVFAAGNLANRPTNLLCGQRGSATALAPSWVAAVNRGRTDTKLIPSPARSEGKRAGNAVGGARLMPSVSGASAPV
jgi:hypothetical protein